MTNLELALNTLAEAAVTEISKERKPVGFNQNVQVAQRGGSVARVARKQLENQLGHSVISSINAKQVLAAQQDNTAQETAYLTPAEKSTLPIVCDDGDV